MNYELLSTPDCEIPCMAVAFYGNSWAEALGKAAFYINKNPKISFNFSEPIIRLVHYTQYKEPFTATLVLPVEKEELKLITGQNPNKQ